MIKTNPLLAHYSLVREQAAHLDCSVQAILGNVILCSRKSDDTFITWQATVYNLNTVEFISGCYDMTEEQGTANLIERATS